MKSLLTFCLCVIALVCSGQSIQRNAFTTNSDANLPKATTSSLGIVQVDGTTITVTGGGIISATGGSGGSFTNSSVAAGTGVTITTNLVGGTNVYTVANGANVALLNAAQTFSGSNTFTTNLTITGTDNEMPNQVASSPNSDMTWLLTSNLIFAIDLPSSYFVMSTNGAVWSASASLIPLSVNANGTTTNSIGVFNSGVLVGGLSYDGMGRFAAGTPLRAGIGFHQNGSNGVYSIGTEGLGFTVGGSNSLTLTNTGTTTYVGINNTNPANALDVAGNANVTGSATAASFSGSGASLTALNGTQITSGTVSAARLPVATSSTFGTVEPDNSTITISGGVISASGGGGSASNAVASVYTNGVALVASGATNLDFHFLDGVNKGIVFNPTNNSGNVSIGIGLNTNVCTAQYNVWAPGVTFSAANIYWWGQNPVSEVNGSSNKVAWIALQSGHITAATLNTINSGTVGTTESTSYVLTNYTKATGVSMGSAPIGGTPAAGSGGYIVNRFAFSLSVNAGDVFSVYGTTPSWVTPPGTTQVGWVLWEGQ